MKKHQIAEITTKDSAAALIGNLRKILIGERKARRQSLRALAETIGCSRSALFDFENGSNATNISLVFAYAIALGVDIRMELSDEGRIIMPSNNEF